MTGEMSMEEAEAALFSGERVPEGDLEEAIAAEPEQPEESETEPNEQQAQPEQQTEPEAEPEPSSPQGWQYQAYKDEKEKRQAYERELEQLKLQNEQYKAEFEAFQQQQRALQEQNQSKQDPTEYLQQQIQRQDRQMQIQRSEFLAAQQYGAETVRAADQWWMEKGRSPQLKHAMQTSDDPWSILIEAYRKDQILSTVGDDLEAYNRRILEQANGGQNSSQPTDMSQPQATTTPSLPPRISSTPGAQRAPSSLSMEDADRELFGR